MTDSLNRRTFLGASTAAGVVLAANKVSFASQSDAKVLVGVMGTGGRGSGLARAWQQQTGVVVTYCCDVDQGAAERAAAGVQKVSNMPAPRVVTDYRRMLDDKMVDVVVVAAPNHWHAPAAIAACAANKHVYVE